MQSSSPTRHFIYGVAFFLLTCAFGVGGYVYSGWSFADAVYMVIITIFGVGYGEVRPVDSTELRGFTIALIIGGYGAAVIIAGAFVQIVTAGEVYRALGVRRMTKGLERLDRHSIICGFGRMGRILARELDKGRKSFVVIDRDPEMVRQIEEAGYLAMQGDASEEEVLVRAGVDRAETLATVLPSDAANVFITLTASGLNSNLVILSRAEDPKTERKLLRSGATKVVMPTEIGAHQVANLILRPGAEEFLDQGNIRSLQAELGYVGLRFEELQIQPGSPLIGRSVGDIEVHGNRGFLIVALRKHGGALVLNPTAEASISADDAVIVVGHKDDLPQLRQRYSLRPQLSYRGATL